MKTRMILAVLMTLALVTSSVEVGHAGGGSGASVTATLLDCYAIHNGANSPYTLSVDDQFFLGDHVRLGKSQLLCTQTSAVTVVRGPVLNGNFDPNAADHVKCYDVVPPVVGPTGSFTVSDPLGVETVTLQRLSVLCTPATKEPVTP